MKSNAVSKSLKAAMASAVLISATFTSPAAAFPLNETPGMTPRLQCAMERMSMWLHFGNHFASGSESSWYIGDGHRRFVRQWCM